MSQIRLLILAQDLLARAGLAAILEAESDLYVVGQAPAGESLTEDLAVYRPDVVLFDLGYEPATSMIGLATLVDAEAPVVALLGNEADASAIIGTLADLPAYGLLRRESPARELAQAIQTVATGLVAFDPLMARALKPDERDSFTVPPPLEDLTPREKEVLHLIAQGLPNKGIAVQLEISPNTVKFHVNAILSKLDVSTRTEAVVRATQLGLILL